jgi:hypothetical protein
MGGRIVQGENEDGKDGEDGRGGKRGVGGGRMRMRCL